MLVLFRIVLCFLICPSLWLCDFKTKSNHSLFFSSWDRIQKYTFNKAGSLYPREIKECSIQLLESITPKPRSLIRPRGGDSDDESKVKLEVTRDVKAMPPTCPVARDLDTNSRFWEAEKTSKTQQHDADSTHQAGLQEAASHSE